MTAISWTSTGIPAPQGSKRHVGRGIMIEANKALQNEIIVDSPLLHAVNLNTKNPGIIYDINDNKTIDPLFLHLPKNKILRLFIFCNVFNKIL